jgi:hypothetical protein
VSESNPYRPPATEAPAVPQAPALQGASITGAMLDHLRTTRPWVRFFAVLGFIAVGFMGLGGLGLLVASVVLPGTERFAMMGLGVLYLLLIAVYLLPILKLNNFANALDRVFSSGGVDSVEEALRRQAAFWKTAGILTVVCIALSVLFLIGAAVVGIVMASQ